MTLLVASFSIFTTNVALAQEYRSNTVNVSFTFEPILTLTTSGNINMSVTPGTKVISDNYPVTVDTNNAAGYTLSATVGCASGTDCDNSTSLKNNSNAFAMISSTTALTAGVWGISTEASPTVDSDFKALALYSGTATILNKTINVEGVGAAGYTGGNTTPFRVGAYAADSQAAGSYKNVVNFAVVANVVSEEQQIYLETALNLASGTETMVKDGVTYYTMQSMTHEICNQVNVLGEASQLQMIDKRDGSLYWVTRLKDGHCWMTQNLDLNLETTPSSVAALNSTNTDLNTYGSNGYDSSNGYTCSNASTTTNCTASGETITWAPERATIATGNLSDTTWTDDRHSPYSYDRGIIVADGSNAYNGHKYAGNYYNWSAAIASNNSSSFASSTLSNVANNPQNSICPKGWRLPTIANNTTFPGTVAGSPNEFRRLNVLYNANVTDDATNLMNAPLYFARSGLVNGGSLTHSGSSAYYWSSTVYSSTIAYNLNFSASAIDPEHYNYRYNGFSVRCVAR